jgi:hypothetical protein
MSSIISVLGRWRLNEYPEWILESTERIVHLSPRTQGKVYALRGVASSDLDIVVTDDVESPRDARDRVVVEVATKEGKYDGAIRDRILLRRIPEHQTRELLRADVCVSEFEDSVDVGVIEGGVAVLERAAWRATYRLWTHLLTDVSRAGDIILWHWRRWYQFLDEGEVRAIAGGFVDEAVGLTLAEANRLASRRLYSLARESGWRKLTLREQRAWGLVGQWHPESRVIQARNSRAGVGEHTVLSATLADHLACWIDERGRQE